jgi:hypothetical protein
MLLLHTYHVAGLFYTAPKNCRNTKRIFALLTNAEVIETKMIHFCAIVLYLLVYHVSFQDGKLCLLVANDKLDGK